jgi:glutamate-5-semialdehyde dehydrogenase
MKLINEKLKNNVLASMMTIIDKNRETLLSANKKDLDAFQKDDQALYDRLVVNDAKIDEMINAISEVKNQTDPVSKEISSR